MNQTAERYTGNTDSYYRNLLGLWLMMYVLLFMATSQFVPDIPFLEKPVIWFGKNILHLPKLEKITMTGSGDTTYDYVLILLILFCSAILALVVMMAGRNKRNYRSWYLFVIVLARYYVAFTMLAYGFAKIFDGQFGPLSYYSLEEKLGNMSPMGVLWNFMESSRAYTFFGGLMEVTGGLLLFFRKTKTFGALFSMTVMINVAILNFTYDVPVKIFSAHIVFLCFFILTYEWKKLYRFFFLHKPEVLDYRKLTVSKKWMKITLRSVKFLLIAYLIYTFFINPLLNFRRDNVPLEGYYTTRLFILNRDTLPENPADTTRWNHMYIAYSQGLNVVRQENTFSWYNSKIDSVARTLVLHKNNDTAKAYATFRYRLDNDTMKLEGKIGIDSARILFTRKKKKDYPLISRGFNWINEYPYNR